MNGPVLSTLLRRVRLLTLLPLSMLLLMGLVSSWSPGSGLANTTDTSPVYLPLLMKGGTAQASLAGRVRFWSGPQTAVLQPVRYVVVLDVSGSMNFSFDGQGINNGTIMQCGNSPDPEKDRNRETCQPNDAWAWEPLAERRIYVARQAISQLVGLLNIPGNDAYDATMPMDQMRLVAFEKRVKATTDWSSDKETLLENAKTVGQKGEYTTEGGTNGGAGLYQAALFLNGDNTVTDDSGHVYTYKTVVIFVTDGVSNYFLMKELPNQGYGIMANAAPHQFPNSEHCATMDQRYIAEAVECQINETAGGPYTHTNGITYDRPITAMMNTSRDLLQANGHEVYVIAVSAIPDTGLKDGVASSPNHYQEARLLEVDVATGLNNVDQAFRQIANTVNAQRESAGTEGSWLHTITPNHRPHGFPEGVVGVITLTNTNAQKEVFSVPITLDVTEVTGHLTFAFNEIPPGTYTLRATLFYQDDNQHLDTYSIIQTEENGRADTITITLKPDEEYTLDPLSLLQESAE